MQIQPLFDRVVLKAVEVQNLSSSGIYIPESSTKERPFLYEVIAIGPGKGDIDMSGLTLGDQVLAGQYSGDEVKVDGQEFKIVSIEYILAKIN